MLYQIQLNIHCACELEDGNMLDIYASNISACTWYTTVVPLLSHEMNQITRINVIIMPFRIVAIHILHKKQSCCIHCQKRPQLKFVAIVCTIATYHTEME